MEQVLSDKVFVVAGVASFVVARVLKVCLVALTNVDEQIIGTTLLIIGGFGIGFLFTYAEKQAKLLDKHKVQVPTGPAETVSQETKGLKTRKLSKEPSQPGLDEDVWWTLKTKEYSDDQEVAIQTIIDTYYGDLAPEEKRKKAMQTVINNDIRAAAIRALTAREFDVEATCKLIDDMLKWREDLQVDTILTRPIDDDLITGMRRCLVDGFTGICNDGKPVYIFFAGKIDFAKCKKVAGGVEPIVQYHVQVMEYAQKVYYEELSKKIGTTINKLTLLLDLSGFGSHNLKPAFWDICGMIGGIDNNYYFEYLHKVVIVNPGMFFRFFWRTSSGMLEPKTREKFHVVNNIKDLQEHIPLHQLPEYFGGTVQNEGSFCTKETPWTHHYRSMDDYIHEQARGNARRDNQDQAAVE